MLAGRVCKPQRVRGHKGRSGDHAEEGTAGKLSVVFHGLHNISQMAPGSKLLDRGVVGQSEFLFLYGPLAEAFGSGSSPRISEISHMWFEIPASIAGVTRNVA